MSVIVFNKVLEIHLNALMPLSLSHNFNFSTLAGNTYN